MKEEPRFFVHSSCCMAHWELVVNKDGTADLLCEKCGKSAGPSVFVTVNTHDGTKCDCCEKGSDE